MKSGRIIRRSDVTGLRSFAEAHPTVPRVVVAPTRHPYTIDPKIEVMPVTDYLDRLAQIV